MASKKNKRNAGLNLTQEESESLGMGGLEEPAPVTVGMRELPFMSRPVVLSVKMKQPKS